MDYYNDTELQLEVRKSLIPDAGRGVFAGKYIPSGTIFGRYRGALRRIGEKGFKKNGPYAMKINHRVYIDAVDTPRCILAMMNDADGPSHSSKYENNCVFVGAGKKIQAQAIRDIYPGEELLVDYDNEYWV